MCRCAELRKEKTFHSTGPFIVFCCCCYLLFTTFGRIGFKSRGILTFGPFGLLFVSFFMSASSRLAHEQTSIHKYPNLFHGCTACKYANVKLCVRSVVSRLAGRTGPREIKTDEPRNQPTATSCDRSSRLRTSLISARLQMTVFSSYSDEPEKPKKR